MNPQCNQCGGFHNPQPCPACATLICENCRANHNLACERARKLQGQGRGPTVKPQFPLPEVALVPPTGLDVISTDEAEVLHLEGTQAANADLIPPLPPATGAEVVEIAAAVAAAEQEAGSIDLNKIVSAETLSALLDPAGVLAELPKVEPVNDPTEPVKLKLPATAVVDPNDVPSL